MMDGAIVQSVIIPGLKEMTNDPDRDLKYYATIALRD
jgi:hypothetical protein